MISEYRYRPETSRSDDVCPQGDERRKPVREAPGADFCPNWPTGVVAVCSNREGRSPTDRPLTVHGESEST